MLAAGPIIMRYVFCTCLPIELLSRSSVYRLPRHPGSFHLGLEFWAWGGAIWGMFKSGVPMKSFSALGVGCGFVSAKAANWDFAYLANERSG